MSYVPGGSDVMVSSYPDGVNCAPKMLPRSERGTKYRATPAKIAAPPPTGKAQTCTASTPGPCPAAVSIAQPPRKKPLDETVAPAPGVSSDIIGLLEATVTATVRTALNEPATVLCM